MKPGSPPPAGEPSAIFARAVLGAVHPRACGVVACCKSWTAHLPVHPRACGATDCWPFAHWAIWGSSPRAPGWTGLLRGSPDLARRRPRPCGDRPLSDEDLGHMLRTRRTDGDGPAARSPSPTRPRKHRADGDGPHPDAQKRVPVSCPARTAVNRRTGESNTPVRSALDTRGATPPNPAPTGKAESPAPAKILAGGQDNTRRRMERRRDRTKHEPECRQRETRVE